MAPDRPVVAVSGASGRLGTAVVRALLDQGLPVRALDVVEGIYPDTVDHRHVDLTDGRSLDAALDGVDVLVHVAGLHGAHLAAGVSRREVWRVNVGGTWRLLNAARRVNRIIFASSTSVFGSGSRTGPARVLDERTPACPVDVYDLSKLTGERMLDRVRESGREAVALRLGRFYYGNRFDYHLRKLSTGLDLHDAASAFVACVRTSATLRPAYCVVSDLALPDEQRRRLGIDLPAVVAEAVPGLDDMLHRLGHSLPPRYGKSASTAALRTDVGWAPARDLRWWSAELGRAFGAGPDHERPARIDPALPGPNGTAAVAVLSPDTVKD